MLNRFLSCALLIASILLAVSPSTGWAQTEASGSIDSDETWTADNSPYLVTGSVTLEPEAILTTEEDVVVDISSDRSIYARGELIADDVTFEGG